MTQDQEYRLDKVDIIVEKSEEMAAFYGSVFNIDFQPFDMDDHVFYLGQIPGLCKVQLVPGSVMNVSLERNRQQLNFWVPDLDRVMKVAVEKGGEAHGEVEDNGDFRAFSVRDPDGNYLVITGK